jgi:hypothetical protein
MNCVQGGGTWQEKMWQTAEHITQEVYNKIQNIWNRLRNLTILGIFADT